MATTPITLLKRCALAVFSSVLLAGSAQAFSLQISAGRLTDGDGQDLSNGSLVVLVVDLNRDGIAAPDASSFAPGADDFIIGDLGAQFLTGQGTLASGQIVRNDLSLGDPAFDGGPSIDSGDPISLFWYPEVTHAAYTANNDLAPGETPFGAYNFNSDTPNPSWVVPDGDGDTVDLQALTDTLIGGAGIPGQELQALMNTNGAMIPEPSSALLALLGSGFLFFRRNRRA